MPREYQQAFSVIALNLEHLSLLPHHAISSTHVCDTGSMFLFEGLLKSGDVPCNPHWKWNQAKGRERAILHSENAVIEFFKLIPRRKQCTTHLSLPSMKLWQYNITMVDSGENRTMFWCEKGEDEWLILLEDLKFLSEFMHPQVVNQIWYNSNKVMYSM